MFSLDVPFNNVTFSFGQAFTLIQSESIISDDSNAYFIRFDRIVSINLKNAIINYYSQMELSNISTVTANTIIENYNDLGGDFYVVGYENLESIVIQEESLQNVRSLIIKENPSLTSIEIKKNACMYVFDIELSSIHLKLGFTMIFLI